MWMPPDSSERSERFPGDEMSECPHIHLNKKLVGSISWYQCANRECNMKFKAVPWDGKVTVLPASDGPEKES